MTDPTAQLVTVFGGGGFIGRYVCEYLLKTGVRVRVASRNSRSAHFIQPLGQVGQIGFVRADVAHTASVERAVDGADAVVNLCGVFGRAMQATHVAGAATVARAAAAAGATALVHISAIGADPASPSNYGRTKGEGEAAVRAAFPAATIIRPSLVFGPEDALTNRFAGMARLPLLPILAARRKFQPVFVRDLAQAIALAALDPARHGGKGYDVGGPQVMSMVELHRAVLGVTGQAPQVVELPDIAGKILSWFGWLPGAPLSKDQWLMLQRDNVPAPGAPGLEAFGIRPAPLAAVAPEWLGRFHRGGKFGGGRRVDPATAA
ncbi:MAG: NAD-dependent epimerase/dehydratase family protein [Sphingomicrobium sp.]